MLRCQGFAPNPDEICFKSNRGYGGSMPLSGEAFGQRFQGFEQKFTTPCEMKFLLKDRKSSFNLASVFFSLLRFFSFAYAIQKKRNEGIKNKMRLFLLDTFLSFLRNKKNNKQNILHPFFSVKNGWSPRKLRPVVTFSHKLI